MNKKRILVVEDEEDILALLHYNLVKNGFEVACAMTGEDGLREAVTNPPDLIILDLMLPGIDGMEVCGKLRDKPLTAKIPVIMLTAKSEEGDVVSGLEVGADDYVTKPFSMGILLARIKSALRRDEHLSQGENDRPTVIDDLTIHPGRNEVLIAGNPVDLTYTEFKILLLLTKRPGWVFSRSQIMDDVRGEDYAVTERAVDVQIAGLRKKLGRCGEYIETVRGVGYRFRS